jgi:hypothetical protein
MVGTENVLGPERFMVVMTMIVVVGVVYSVPSMCGIFNFHLGY